MGIDGLHIWAYGHQQKPGEKQAGQTDCTDDRAQDSQSGKTNQREGANVFSHKGRSLPSGANTFLQEVGTPLSELESI